MVFRGKISKMNKYGNEKTIINNIKFDSKKEGNRYVELLWMQKAKLIKNLELQKKFELQENFMWNGKTIRKIVYICDFFYLDCEKGKYMVEDVKSPITKKNPAYVIKRKIFLKKYGQEYLFFDEV